jgi:hypothetical protein
MIIARSHAQRRAARARGASPAAPEPRNCAGHTRAKQLRWAWTNARANPVAARRRSISRDSSRATRPPASLRRLHPETSRHRTREPRDHAAPSACRITTRRRLAGGVQRTGGRSPSIRGAVSASDRGAISARVPPSSPSRHARSTQYPSHSTLHSARTPPANRTRPSQCTRRGTRTRARRSTPRSTLSPSSSSPETPTHNTQVPARPAATQEQLQSALPLRARGRCACCRTHAREAVRARAPSVPAPASTPRRPPRDATCAFHVRARRLACFADGLRVAPPVQAAADANSRARQPPCLRHLRHDRQARCRHHGHAAVTPRRREACACEACEPVVLEAAAPSAP